jgi:transcriptional regulator with XRE-family HTH domain
VPNILTFIFSTVPTTNLKYLAKNLKYLREKRDLSQAGIEAVTGIRRTTWNNYENEVSTPTLKDFVSIAKIFDVNEHDLLHVDLKKVGNLISTNGGSKNDQNSNLTRKGIGNLIDEITLNEQAAEYKKTLIDKDKIIADQNKIIESQKDLITQLQSQLQRK